MAKIKIDDIRKAAIEHNWELISEEYKNLDSTLEFTCSEGHKVYLPYKHVRDRWICPICEQNQYTKFVDEVKPKSKDIQRTIGLDQATHTTGYSIFDDDTLIYAGTFQAAADDDLGTDSDLGMAFRPFLIAEPEDAVCLEVALEVAVVFTVVGDPERTVAVGTELALVDDLGDDTLHIEVGRRLTC